MYGFDLVICPNYMLSLRAGLHSGLLSSLGLSLRHAVHSDALDISGLLVGVLVRLLNVFQQEYTDDVILFEGCPSSLATHCIWSPSDTTRLLHSWVITVSHVAAANRRKAVILM